MTATNPSAAGAGQPAVQPQPSAAAVAGGVGGAALLVATRVALWLGCSCCWPASWSWAGLSPSGGRSTRRPAGGWSTAVVLSGELTSAVYGDDATPPMFAVIDLSPLASVVSVLVVPLLTELAEPVAYLAWSCRGWRRAWAGRGWAATIVVRSTSRLM